MKVLVCCVVLVGGYIFYASFRKHSKPTQEKSLTANEPTVTMSTADELARHISLRARMRDADRELLDRLEEKRERYVSDPPSAFQRRRYVSEYNEQLWDAIDSVPPRGKPLMHDLERRAEDPDLEAAR